MQSSQHYNRGEDRKITDWKWDMLFARYHWEPQNICKRFCHCHFSFLQTFVLFLHYINSCLSLIPYIAVPSSAGREEHGGENGVRFSSCESSTHSPGWAVMSAFSNCLWFQYLTTGIFASTKDRNSCISPCTDAQLCVLWQNTSWSWILY